MLADEAKALAAELGEWLARPRAEPLKEGVRVVVAGPPNAGKSSLVNALAESRQGHRHRHTRDHARFHRGAAGIDGTPLLLVDTAGLRASDDLVEAIGVHRAEGQLGRADLVLWLGEPEAAPDHPRLLRIHAQCDRRGPAPEGSLAVSALTGEGLDALARRIVAEARHVLPVDGDLALNRRQAQELSEARSALIEAEATDIVRTAEALRLARSAFDRLSGRAGVEDMLDALFGRFCLGK